MIDTSTWTTDCMVTYHLRNLKLWWHPKNLVSCREKYQSLFTLYNSILLERSFSTSSKQPDLKFSDGESTDNFIHIDRDVRSEVFNPSPEKGLWGEYVSFTAFDKDFNRYQLETYWLLIPLIDVRRSRKTRAGIIGKNNKDLSNKTEPKNYGCL